jgi:hypothetical protein
MSESLASNSSRTYSTIWNHFKILENEEGKAQCNYCG